MPYECHLLVTMLTPLGFRVRCNSLHHEVSTNRRESWVSKAAIQPHAWKTPTVARYIMMNVHPNLLKAFTSCLLQVQHRHWSPVSTQSYTNQVSSLQNLKPANLPVERKACHARASKILGWASTHPRPEIHTPQQKDITREIAQDTSGLCSQYGTNHVQSKLNGEPNSNAAAGGKRAKPVSYWIRPRPTSQTNRHCCALVAGKAVGTHQIAPSFKQLQHWASYQDRI